MNGEVKKLIITIGVIFIVILSIFTVITQYQISEINSKDDGLSLFVKILVDETSGLAPFEIRFSSLVTNNNGNVEYQWDFGDGAISIERNPTHTYENNGSYVCSLLITDESGKESSNSVNITSVSNQKPTVSIEAETDKPRRPKSFLLEYILPNIIHIEKFNSNDYRELEKLGFFDGLFKNMDSFYSIEAFANDPDGDEIVSYNWTLRPPSYTTRLANKPVDPVYYYSGKKIDIPAKDIYPAVDYSLTLTVTDSVGEQRSENFQFMVEKSSDRVTFEGKKWIITNAKEKWISQYHSNIIVGGIVLGAAFIILKILKDFVPESLSLPFGKLLVMLFVELILQTSPDEYSDESYMDVIIRIVYKDRLIFRNLNPEKFKKWFDKTEEIFEKLSLEDIALVFQLIEEEIGLDNSRPEITDPYPGDEERFVDLDTEKVFITVKDKEGDPFSVQIYDENGYVDNISGYYPMGQHNDSFNATLSTPLPPNTEITWKVLIIDENDKKVTAEYKFTTRYE